MGDRIARDDDDESWIVTGNTFREPVLRSHYLLDPELIFSPSRPTSLRFVPAPLLSRSRSIPLHLYHCSTCATLGPGPSVASDTAHTIDTALRGIVPNPELYRSRGPPFSLPAAPSLIRPLSLVYPPGAAIPTASSMKYSSPPPPPGPLEEGAVTCPAVDVPRFGVFGTSMSTKHRPGITVPRPATSRRGPFIFAPAFDLGARWGGEEPRVSFQDWSCFEHVCRFRPNAVESPMFRASERLARCLSLHV